MIQFEWRSLRHSTIPIAAQRVKTSSRFLVDPKNANSRDVLSVGRLTCVESITRTRSMQSLSHAIGTTMKLCAFSKCDDGFEILNFRAKFQWKTSASISFKLCHYTSPNVVIVFGWLDVHETSDEWRRTKMRICLDHKYVRFADFQAMIETICVALLISDDSYEATFISPQKQISQVTGCAHEFVSYGPPVLPNDNPWDDRDGVSPLEVISRETAFGMLLEAFPGFHRRIDESDRTRPMRDFGEQFLGGIETLELVEAIAHAVNRDDQNQLRRVFDVLEKLVVFGDEYTRNASVVRLFELLAQRHVIADKLKPLMLPATFKKWEETTAAMTKWSNLALNRSREADSS